ncbi:MAG: hypothetical protein FJZ01_09520 [Candidatus Sericytochromatia bacterium]|nr:hypothetical protein [Candidatus Tanganyikabacteria bacterium]
MSTRKILAVAFVLLGVGAMTFSLFAMRAPADSPTFVGGRAIKNAGGHNPREIFVTGIGMVLILAGGILLVSRGD